MTIKNPNNVEAEVGEVVLASVYVKRQADGSGVMRDNMTPAEMVIVAADGRRLVKGMPITSIEVTGKVRRSKTVEYARLRDRFTPAKLKAVFPGANPDLPQTFEAALEMATQVVVPTEDLVMVDISN